MLRKFSGTVAVHQLRSVIVVLVLGAMTSFWIGQVAGHPAASWQQPTSPASQTQAGIQTRQLPDVTNDSTIARGALSSNVMQQLIYVQQEQQLQSLHTLTAAKDGHPAKSSGQHHTGNDGKGGDD